MKQIIFLLVPYWPATTAITSHCHGFSDLATCFTAEQAELGRSVRDLGECRIKAPAEAFGKW